MTDFIVSFLITRWIEILGILLTVSTGVVMPWLSRKSSNYKKINKKMIVASLIHFGYLAIVPLIGSTTGAFIWGLFVGVGVNLTFGSTVLIYSVMAAVSILAFFVIMRKSKQMINFLSAVKNISNFLYRMLNTLVIIVILQTFVAMPFVIIEHAVADTVMRVVLIISWITQFWWFAMIITIIWKSSSYVYSTIKITMLDGEVIQYDCSPKVCRVHRNYVRIMKRDENNVVIQELQIYEVAIKQIEYLK